MASDRPSAESTEGSGSIFQLRIAQWMAAQALQDRYARLADGGADIDTRFDLAGLFIDLPVAPVAHATPSEEEGDPSAMPLLLGSVPVAEVAFLDPRTRRTSNNRRWLLVGGPGSGKSTVTTMVAQQLRLPRIDPWTSQFPDQLREPWERARQALSELRDQNKWSLPSGAFPLRVSLPYLARWMANQGETASLSLWDYLFARMAEDLGGIGISIDGTPNDLRLAAREAASVIWILDGLDEVPRSAGRAHVVELVRATVCAAGRAATDGVIVATRPQGYGGEFDDLEPLELMPLSLEAALVYAERLLKAWLSMQAPSVIAERLEKARSELSKPEVVELIQTPLHTTMAAILVAGRGTLPAARSMLFEHYFTTIFRRELGKPFEHGIQDVDENVIQALHAQAGITLHVRSQSQMGARASLRRRQMREILYEIYKGLGRNEESARSDVDRIMRFAADRLVLLLHSSEGEYEFGVRSLQEFFAARALLEAEEAVVRRRLETIVLDPHWSNVLAFIVSSFAFKTAKADRERALRLVVDLCRSLNSKAIGGEAAGRCFLGSRLAIHILGETEKYGHPWFHDPLWEVALIAADSPLQTTISAAESTAVGPGTRRGWKEHIEIHLRLGQLAVNWPGLEGGRHRMRILQMASRLMEGSADEKLVGWRLIDGMLAATMPEAVELAEKHAPATAEELERITASAQLTVGWYRLFVQRHSEWLTPVRIQQSWGYDSPRATLTRSIFDALYKLPRIPLRSDFAPDFGGRGLASCASNTSQWRDLLAQITASAPEWTAWHNLARFMSDPSHILLADVIEATHSSVVLRELQTYRYLLPWPLQAILEFTPWVETPASLSQMIRAGHLGSVNDWLAAEERWSSRGTWSMHDLDAWVDADGPWNSDISVRGIASPSLYSNDELSALQASRDMFLRLVDHLALAETVTVNAVRALTETAALDVSVPVRLARAIAAKQRETPRVLAYSLLMFLPDFIGSEAEEWCELLDEQGRAGRPSYLYLDPDDDVRYSSVLELSGHLINKIQERPERWGILDVLADIVEEIPDTDLSHWKLPPLPSDSPPRAHALCSLLTLLSGECGASDLSTLLPKLVGTADSSTGQPEFDLRRQLASIFRFRARESTLAIPILLAALDTTPPPSSGDRDYILGALFAVHRRSITASFSTAESWRDHDLPLPFLGVMPPARPPNSLLGIRELTNLRLFRETPVVSAPFPRPAGDRGQWILLVGENGVGKTTLLRAIALTLTSPTIASKLLDERLPMMRNGQESRIALELETGVLSIAIRRDQRTEYVESLSPPDALRPWVIGYGVRRGNARGEKDRDAEVGPIGELHTLFDRPASLHNAVQWLKDLDGDVLREQRKSPRSPDAPPGPRERIWRSVQFALREILGVTKIEVDDSGLVYVEHPQLARVRLDALSDGYLTTAGWVIDMIARWIDRQTELDEPLGADLLRQMCGFVLLDEIDLHLHPMWQMKIIDDVRRLFPRLSFIVTTHNPLTLQGARPGEVYVVRRDGPKIELFQRDIRPGHDVDRVLFEQFGVEHTFDKKTRDLLDKHRELIEKGASRHDPERVKIEAQLTERFANTGDTLKAERGASQDLTAPLQPEERSLLTALLKKS